MTVSAVHVHAQACVLCQIGVFIHIYRRSHGADKGAYLTAGLCRK
jgi:hypothetical protein